MHPSLHPSTAILLAVLCMPGPASAQSSDLPAYDVATLCSRHGNIAPASAEGFERACAALQERDRISLTSLWDKVPIAIRRDCVRFVDGSTRDAGGYGDLSVCIANRVAGR